MAAGGGENLSGDKGQNRTEAEPDRSAGSGQNQAGESAEAGAPAGGEGEDESPAERAQRRRRALDLRASLTNLPNILTMARVAAIPVVLWFMDNFSPARSFIACLIYIGAAVTDYLDGWLARRRKQVSLLGKFLDPLADKLIVSATLIYATWLHRVPPWLVVALLARDLAITGLRSLAAAEGLVISASDQGKQKTAFQMTGTIFVLIHFKYKILFVPYELNFNTIGLYTLYVSLVMSIISALAYTRLFVRAVAARVAGGR